MNTRGIQWVRPPTALNPAIRNYGERVIVAVHAIAEYVGAKMQGEARIGAPWTDRTGNARSGIFYAVQGERGLVIGMVPVGAMGGISRDYEIVEPEPGAVQIFLSHTMYYGRYLELSNGGRYGIIVSTMRANLPVLEQMLQRAFR